VAEVEVLQVRCLQPMPPEVEEVEAMDMEGEVVAEDPMVPRVLEEQGGLPVQAVVMEEVVVEPEPVPEAPVLEETRVVQVEAVPELVEK